MHWGLDGNTEIFYCLWKLFHHPKFFLLGLLGLFLNNTSLHVWYLENTATCFTDIFNIHSEGNHLLVIVLPMNLPTLILSNSPLVAFKISSNAIQKILKIIWYFALGLTFAVSSSKNFLLNVSLQWICFLNIQWFVPMICLSYFVAFIVLLNPFTQFVSRYCMSCTASSLVILKYD